MNLYSLTIDTSIVHTLRWQELMFRDRGCNALFIEIAHYNVGMSKQCSGLIGKSTREKLADDSRADLAAGDLLLLDHHHLEIITTLQKVVDALLLMAETMVVTYNKCTRMELRERGAQTHTLAHT